MTNLLGKTRPRIARDVSLSIGLGARSKLRRSPAMTGRSPVAPSGTVPSWQTPDDSARARPVGRDSQLCGWPQSELNKPAHAMTDSQWKTFFELCAKVLGPGSWHDAAQSTSWCAWTLFDRLDGDFHGACKGLFPVNQSTRCGP